MSILRGFAIKLATRGSIRAVETVVPMRTSCDSDLKENCSRAGRNGGSMLVLTCVEINLKSREAGIHFTWPNLCRRLRIVCICLRCKAIEFLTIDYKLQYIYCDTRYDTGRENPLPARGRRFPTWFGARHDPASGGERCPQRAGPEHQPV